MTKKPKLHLIPLEMFCLDVAVFASEDERIETLTAQGCDDLTRHSDAALSSAHQDFTRDGNIRLAMVIKPEATKATWAHECVHVADFVIDYLGLPTSVEGTEVRAYMVGYLFSRLQKIMRKRK